MTMSARLMFIRVMVLSLMLLPVAAHASVTAATSAYQLVRLQAGDMAQYAKASISLHPYILASDRAALTIDVRLPAAELTALKD